MPEYAGALTIQRYSYKDRSFLKGCFFMLLSIVHTLSVVTDVIEDGVQRKIQKLCPG